MKFIKMFLDQIDSIWALWTVLITPIAGMFLVQYLPIPTLGHVGLVVGWQRLELDLLQRGWITSAESMRARVKAVRAKRTFIFFLILMVAVVYVGFIYYDIYGEKKLLCGDYTDYIPGTLPALLQHFLHPDCPAAGS
jgi:hypothetical protein